MSQEHLPQQADGNEIRLFSDIPDIDDSDLEMENASRTVAGLPPITKAQAEGNRGIDFEFDPLDFLDEDNSEDDNGRS